MPIDVIWSRPAENDLAQIWTYLAEEASPQHANELVLAIASACDALAAHPRKGRRRDELRPGLRSVLSEPYVIFYRVRGITIEIVRILHGRRDIVSIFGLGQT